MSSTAEVQSAPITMRLPAILQNPTNHSLRQVEAHNAQQREKVSARREAKAAPSQSGNIRGKRVIRRRDNAAFVGNTHIIPPSKSDYTPPIPLQLRPTGPIFPPNTLPRSIPIPPVQTYPSDLYSPSSVSGTFSTSLKGTRSLLRKGGRRAEKLVRVVEEELRAWLGDSWGFGGERESTWRVVDEDLVECGTSSGGSPGTRRLPVQYQTEHIPSLPFDGTQLPAILELSRSHAHITWGITDSFERLVVHLIVRYYELVSWSEDHQTTTAEPIRLTHIIKPRILRPKPLPQSHALLTPETTDLSSDATISEGSDTETETETDSIAGYSLAPLPTQIQMADPELELELELVRVDSGSSMYASSEGGDGSVYSDLGDSGILPPLNGGGGWVAVRHEDMEDREIPRRSAAMGLSGGRGWEGKPSFFEYLYG